MEKYIESLKKEIQNNLSASALAYLKVGMQEFHKVRDSTYLNFQPAVGNLGIAIELMLKSLIAKNSFTFLYDGLPIELQIMLTYPESIHKASNPRHFAGDLKSFSHYKLIEINKCVDIFYIYHSELKQEYKPHFDSFSSVRNISVHASLPSLQRYDLERMAYLALQLYMFLRGEKVFGYQYYTVQKEDKKFLETYAKERVERVKKKIEEAKRQSKQIKHLDLFISVEGWESYVTKCPICGCEGILDGYTEMSGESYVDDERDKTYDDFSLNFFADRFKCDSCGLELLDMDELKLAGMETVYDRSSELDEWHEAEAYDSYSCYC